MSNVIRFLESMGSEARWGDVTKDAMESALAIAEVEGPLRSAILDRDVGKLQVLLQQKPFASYIIPGEEEEEEEEGGDEPGEEGGAKDTLSLSSPLLFFQT